MRILGLDPSLTCTGWAIVENCIVIHSGTIKTKAKQSLAQRLKIIQSGILEILDMRQEVDYVAIEDVFVNHRNMKTSIQLAKVHGVIIGAVLSIYIDEVIKVYAPRFVKQVVTGNGNASKEQVLKMVKLQSGYKGNQLDESDAIAVALTCEREIK
jgi:crossover junction endodeoxyribonuclease RuvC